MSEFGHLWLVMLVVILGTYHFSTAAPSENIDVNDQSAINRQVFNQILRELILLHKVKENEEPRNNDISRKAYSKCQLERPVEFLDKIYKITIKKVVEEIDNSEDYDCKVRGGGGSTEMGSSSSSASRGVIIEASFNSALLEMEPRLKRLLREMRMFTNSPAGRNAQFFRLLFSFAARLASNRGIVWTSGRKSPVRAFLTAFDCFRSAGNLQNEIFDSEIYIPNGANSVFSSNVFQIRWSTTEKNRQKYAENFKKLVEFSKRSITPYEVANFMAKIDQQLELERQNDGWIFQVRESASPIEMFLSGLSKNGSRLMVHLKKAKEIHEIRLFAIGLAIKIAGLNVAEQYFLYFKQGSSDLSGLDSYLEHLHNGLQKFDNELYVASTGKFKQKIMVEGIESESFYQFAQAIKINSNISLSFLQMVEHILKGLEFTKVGLFNLNSNNFMPETIGAYNTRHRYLHLKKMQKMELPLLHLHFFGRKISEKGVQAEMELQNDYVEKSLEAIDKLMEKQIGRNMDVIVKNQLNRISLGTSANYDIEFDSEIVEDLMYYGSIFVIAKWLNELSKSVAGGNATNTIWKDISIFIESNIFSMNMNKLFAADEILNAPEEIPKVWKLMNSIKNKERMPNAKDIQRIESLKKDIKIAINYLKMNYMKVRNEGQSQLPKIRHYLSALLREIKIHKQYAAEGYYAGKEIMYEMRAIKEEIINYLKLSN